MSPPPIDERRAFKETVGRAAMASHPAREPSDPPDGFPPAAIPGSGSPSPTIERYAATKASSWLERIKLAHTLFAIGFGLMTWVGARISTLREDIRTDMATVAASAAASAASEAIRHRFEDHPPNALGEPQESLADRLKGAGEIVQWAGMQADAQARTDHEIASLKSRVTDLEKKGKGK